MDTDDDKLEQYIRLKRFYHFEGESGVRKLETLVKDIGGYNSLHDFLADNPGACEAIMNFVQEFLPRNSEWEDNLTEVIESEGPQS